MRHNGDRFLDAFNRIDEQLRREALAEAVSLSFADRVWASRLVLAEDRRLLESFAGLRNAIVHQADRRLIAEPTDWSVAEIERIADRLGRRPTVEDVLGPRRVVTTTPDASVLDVAQVMLAKDYSQMPVYEGSAFQALLTFETIARWMAATLDRDEILEAAPIAVVLTHAEVTDDFLFVSRTATVVEVLEAFARERRASHPLHAVLVSNFARTDAPPDNIVTAQDLALLRDAILGSARVPH